MKSLATIWVESLSIIQVHLSITHLLSSNILGELEGTYKPIAHEPPRDPNKIGLNEIGQGGSRSKMHGGGRRFYGHLFHWPESRN
jgi:hypothetical protein